MSQLSNAMGMQLLCTANSAGLCSQYYFAEWPRALKLGYLLRRPLEYRSLTGTYPMLEMLKPPVRTSADHHGWWQRTAIRSFPWFLVSINMYPERLVWVALCFYRLRMSLLTGCPSALQVRGGPRGVPQRDQEKSFQRQVCRNGQHSSDSLSGLW